MNVTKKILIAGLSVALAACGGEQTESTLTTDAESMEASAEDAGAEAMEDESGEASAVSIWDKVSVRETPAADGKWMTSLSLGETLTFLGDEETDSKDKKYYKVKLNDGKEGWCRYEFVVPGAKPAVFLNNTDMYSRPDLLTKTDKKFSKMDIVGVKGEQNDWIEVTGKRSDGKWIDKGWIKTSNISYRAEDIAMAKFAKPILAITDPAQKEKKLEELLDNADLKNSSFIPDLRNAYDELLYPEEDVIEEAMDEEYNEGDEVIE